jgi:O-methyltransferase involved in polyketide biosynthesis
VPEAAKIPIDFTGAAETMLATLHARALDADADKPVLGDTFAKDLVSRIDYDWRKTGVTARNASAGVVRSALFDNWARRFLALHDRAVVLHLGCGLDDRVFRLDPGPDVEWYDVDYPNVVALVEQLYPAREHYHPVAACVTDPAWLSAIPADRPVLLIAEGLTYYLTRDDGFALLRRLVEALPFRRTAFRRVQLACHQDAENQPGRPSLGIDSALGNQRAQRHPPRRSGCSAARCDHCLRN